jgi:hypothetical protein
MEHDLFLGSKNYTFAIYTGVDFAGGLSLTLDARFDQFSDNERPPWIAIFKEKRNFSTHISGVKRGCRYCLNGASVGVSWVCDQGLTTRTKANQQADYDSIQLLLDGLTLGRAALIVDFLHISFSIANSRFLERQF